MVCVCVCVLQVLLVFAKDDAQSNSFCWACERAGFRCNVTRSPEAAMESFQEKNHDLILIDHRHSRSFDAEALCRYVPESEARSTAEEQRGGRFWKLIQTLTLKGQFTQK